MRYFLWPMMAGATLTLPGCVAKAAWDVATVPVKVAGKGADVATTSQSEADRNRGRDLRKREEKLGKLEREYAKERKACVNGDDRGCRAAPTTYDEIQVLQPTVPAAPQR